MLRFRNVDRFVPRVHWKCWIGGHDAVNVAMVFEVEGMIDIGSFLKEPKY